MLNMSGSARKQNLFEALEMRNEEKFLQYISCKVYFTPDTKLAL